MWCAHGFVMERIFFYRIVTRAQRYATNDISFESRGRQWTNVWLSKRVCVCVCVQRIPFNILFLCRCQAFVCWWIPRSECRRINLTVFLRIPTNKPLHSRKNVHTKKKDGRTHMEGEGGCQSSRRIRKISSRWQMFALPQHIGSDVNATKKKKIKKLLTSVLQSKICSCTIQPWTRSLHCTMKGNNKK